MCGSVTVCGSDMVWECHGVGASLGMGVPYGKGGRGGVIVCEESVCWNVIVCGNVIVWESVMV